MNHLLLDAPIGTGYIRRKLTLKEIGERLGNITLSKEAVAQYKLGKMTEYGRAFGREGEYFVHRQDKLYHKKALAEELKPVSLYLVAVTLVMSVASGFAIFAWPSRVGTVLSFFCSLAGLALSAAMARWAVPSAKRYRTLYWALYRTGWEKATFDPLGKLRVLLPANVHALCIAYAKKAPDAEFVLHTFKEDPFVEIKRNREGVVVESEYICGWDGDRELVEIDGQIQKMPAL